MSAIAAVTVYAASSRQSPPAFLALAGELGRGLAELGLVTVYGGARVGMMGALAEGALAAGGRVEGVILDEFSDVAHDGLHVLETVGDMRSRKAGLADRGDAFVVLPGALGTLEEVTEVMVERQLGFHHKPIVLVNHEGFWDSLLALLDRQLRDGVLAAAHREIPAVVPDARGALDFLAAARSPQ